jgi:D-xylonolactonase
MNTITLECIWPLGAQLAEGPVWSAAEQCLYFVDIKGHKIHRCKADGSDQRSWDAPQAIGFLQPLANGDFVVGLKDGLYRFSPDTGAFAQMLMVETDLPGNRLNDANVDARGQLWFGTMDDAEEAASGCLYRVNSNADLLAMDPGYVITNGPATSPDGRTFYHTDTLNQSIYAFDLSEQGALSGKRLFIKISNGYPDGTAVDSAGHLWVALFAGGRIERYNDQGVLVETIPMPCANVTKLAFGGADLRTAFVTTAWKGLSKQERECQPLAGGIFTFRVDTPGLPQHAITEGFSR